MIKKWKRKANQDVENIKTIVSESKYEHLFKTHNAVSRSCQVRQDGLQAKRTTTSSHKLSSFIACDFGTIFLLKKSRGATDSASNIQHRCRCVDFSPAQNFLERCKQKRSTKMCVETCLDTCQLDWLLTSLKELPLIRCRISKLEKSIAFSFWSRG